MENTAKHKLHIYTGNGKGKTSAAMGLALRMLGHGKQVLIAQFMKQPNSGELAALRQLPGAHIVEMAPMWVFTYQMDEEGLALTQKKQTQSARQLQEEIARLQPDLCVLDELCVALSQRLIPEDLAVSLVQTGLQYGEVAVTGRGAAGRLVEMADYISTIAATRHPFQEGVGAREGIEW
jgi:cob(I)alamin adenosyltransferase